MDIRFSINFGKEKVEPVTVTAPQKAETTELVKNTEQVITVGREALLDEFSEMIRKAFREEEEYYKNSMPVVQTAEMPVISSGRVSLYEGFGNFQPNKNSPVPTNFNFENLRLLANLGMFNRHISMAADNLITLANTDYDLDFGEGVGPELAKVMRKYLWGEVKNWYEFADGEDSLDNDILAQLALYGAISAECVIRPDLKGISKIVRVDPYRIRFAYDTDTNSHIPLQQANTIAKTDSKYPGYIELNQFTYNYIAMRRVGEMPYAIPPFLSALEDIFTETDMIGNFKNMMRRMGMLGFLSVLVKAPVALDGENSTVYFNRLQSYLESLRPGVEKGFSRGVVMGFEGTHQFNLEGTNMNSGNAENLMKIVKSLVYSGVKQDPNMHGDNYATTETFGRVILEKFTAQVINYQKPLATFKSRIFLLALLMKGFRVTEVNCKYQRPSTHDEVREQTVRAAKQINLRADYNDGLIDQDQRAHALGYDKPALPEPRITPEQKLAQDTLKQSAKDQKAKKALVRIKKQIGFGNNPFSYNVPQGCEHLSLDDDESIDPVLLALIIAYLHSVQLIYSSAIESAYSSLVREFKRLDTTAHLDSVQSTLINNLLLKWGNDYLPQLDKSIEKNVSKLYSKFRKDKSIFSGIEAPKPNLLLLDAQAIKFIEEMDKHYLGKFIGDPDTQARLNKWIKEKYDAGDIPLGGSAAAINEFISDFSDMVEKESWKIDRVIATSTAMARNFAGLMYLDQSGVETFEVVEVMDGKTCLYCQHMNGMKFSVKGTVDKFEKMFDKGIDSLSAMKPFATTIKIDEFKKMTDQELFNNNISLPPYHPHCRGVVKSVS